tara:strand:- start:174 stop:497 length:324 start_codon:yes stop_codon:yes gene_type:complete
MNRVGDRGFKMVANQWMRDQKRKGDGLKFMQWLYKPGLARKALWPIVKIGMLRKKELQDGRIVHRMPFRRALKRDVWKRSERAEEIRDQWKSTRIGGGNISFRDSET